jgi:hypothetical protein
MVKQMASGLDGMRTVRKKKREITKTARKMASGFTGI